MKKIDLTGQVFGRLTVVQEAGIDTRGEKLWMCECECGGKTTTYSSSLRGGKTKSCGCMKYEGSNTKHGMYGTQEYYIWQGMLKRCYNKNSPYYARYGGRGITVCDRWHKFENFYDDMRDKPEGLSLERIDNNKEYSKDNCMWATSKEQANNRENNVVLTYGGKTQSISMWEQELGFKHGTLWMRVNTYGWAPEKAIETPVVPVSREPVTAFGKTQSLRKHAADYGFGLSTIQLRLKTGMSLEEALTTPRKIVAGIKKGR